MNGNGLERVTLPLRACVATGRTHCTIETDNLRERCRRRRLFLRISPLDGTERGCLCGHAAVFIAGLKKAGGRRRNAGIDRTADGAAACSTWNTEENKIAAAGTLEVNVPIGIKRAF